ncbi:MAG: GIY-YIG nuclease family protein [Leuconostoc pseudomesenteroides]|uniref:GIY-YIG nuclease family protein n=1 Tax=Leuconostoc pseudomesenteroides TaxID=33968 RepID=UPI001E4B7C01|nr:GIY-YIG nuclease family protein [Leuconostoc pseudomesenteroides]MCC7668269.1 hypothetical protein [Leuconostoc pseudomesenteroides]
MEYLSSNSQINAIQAQHPRYKVGVATTSVQKRIANAVNEPTYLYAPVKIIGEIKVINLKAESLENALYHALAKYQLNVDITIGNGRIVNPREWSVVDFDTIQEIAQKIVAQLQSEV